MAKRDLNSGFGQTIAASSDKIVAAYRQALPEAAGTIIAQLTKLGAGAVSVDLAAAGTNTIEGEAKLEVSAVATGRQLNYEMVAPFVMGKIMLSEALIASAFEQAKTLAAADNAGPTMTAVPTMSVDLAKVTAAMAGDLVVYTSVELPTWQFHVAVDSLRLAENHKLVASHILASIRGNTLNDFHRVAAFKQTEFALPAVQATQVKAALASEVVGYRPEDFTPQAVHEQLTAHNLVAAGLVKPPVRASGEVIADQQRFDFENGLRASVTALAMNHVKAKGAELPKVISVDFSGARRRLDGLAAGKVLVGLQFYAENSLQATELEIPFNVAGTVEIDKIAPSATSIKAAAEKAEELRILSEQQAKEQLDAYRKDKAIQAQQILGSTAQGANEATTNAVERVPVLKALLPATTKPGDKFELAGGYVYIVAATNYHSVSVETSGFWMLCLLRDELPGKYPGLGMWG